MKRDIISADSDAVDATSPQSGAICWRSSQAGIDILLISSRDTGRWVVPKGWPIKGLSAAAVAAREAWEEAGVRGRLCETSLGLFSYEKMLADDQSRTCNVALFGLRVDKLARRYPERHQRKRKWFALRAAADLVSEPELSALLIALDKETRGDDQQRLKKLMPPSPDTLEGNS